MEEDQALVDGILNGNMDDFNILIRKYESAVLRFIYSITRDWETSKDITQEVFITLYNKLYTYRKQYSFSNWVYSIARNKCIDYMRKVRKSPATIIKDDTPSYRDLPEEAVEYFETKESISKFLETLSETDRYILSLKYSKDVTFGDVAQIMGMNESTVKKRFYKIREQYRAFAQCEEGGIRYAKL